MSLGAYHTPPSGGTLLLWTQRRNLYAAERPDLAPGDYVVIEVVDSGGGMEAHVAAYAFDAYVTTKSRDATKGTGLGLAIVYGIAKAHRGLAEVASSGPVRQGPNDGVEPPRLPACKLVDRPFPLFRREERHSTYVIERISVSALQKRRLRAY